MSIWDDIKFGNKIQYEHHALGLLKNNYDEHNTDPNIDPRLTQFDKEKPGSLNEAYRITSSIDMARGGVSSWGLTEYTLWGKAQKAQKAGKGTGFSAGTIAGILSNSQNLRFATFHLQNDKRKAREKSESAVRLAEHTARANIHSQSRGNIARNQTPNFFKQEPIRTGTQES